MRQVMAEDNKKVKYTDLSDQLIEKYDPHNLIEYFELRWRLAGRKDYKVAKSRFVAQVIMKGEINLSIGNVSYDLGPGQGYILNLNNDHQIKISNYNAFQVKTVTFSPTSIMTFLDKLSPSEKKILCPEENELETANPDIEIINRLLIPDIISFDDQYFNLVQNVINPLKKSEPGAKMESFHYSQLLLLHLFRRQKNNKIHSFLNFEPNSIMKTEVKKRLIQSIEYIHENYNKGITLDGLCKIACLSKYYYIKQFKELTHMTPMEYMTNLKLQKAKEMLIKKNASITAIAASLGFLDLASFSHFFIRHMGISPTDYKKQC